MSDEIYMALLERLNMNAVKLPPLGSVLALLRDLYTPEEAAMAAKMPVGAHRAEELAGLLKRDKTELERMLETLADDGSIFVIRAESGEKTYAIPPFAPGIFELQFLKGEETEKAKRRAQLIVDIHKEIGPMLSALFKDVKAANERMGTPGLRTLAVEEELPGNAEIATWERISALMEGEDSFAVGTCTCRQQAKFEDHPCKIEGVPMETCVFFGRSADFIVDRKFGRRLSREELLELLRTCGKYGLMHNINNFLGSNIVLCNCCGCCCDILRPMVKHPGLKRAAGSNFIAVVDAESCIGCGECMGICQMYAIEMPDGTARINQESCMGCGNCVSRCPAGSLTLKRCADYMPPRQGDNIIGFGI
jgi:NAD-dependent dihydropyrimidine dehydrogenase PreA subunit